MSDQFQEVLEQVQFVVDELDSVEKPADHDKFATYLANLLETLEVLKDASDPLIADKLRQLAENTPHWLLATLLMAVADNIEE